MNVLRLNVCAKYWHQIESGQKKEEYRLFKPYWIKRLNKQYDEIHICLGYPKSGDKSKTLIRPWKGFSIKEIQHEIFGNKKQKVFAIIVN